MKMNANNLDVRCEKATLSRYWLNRTISSN